MHEKKHHFEQNEDTRVLVLLFLLAGILGICVVGGALVWKVTSFAKKLEHVRQGVSTIIRETKVLHIGEARQGIQSTLETLNEVQSDMEFFQILTVFPGLEQQYQAHRELLAIVEGGLHLGDSLLSVANSFQQSQIIRLDGSKNGFGKVIFESLPSLTGAQSSVDLIVARAKRIRAKDLSGRGKEARDEIVQSLNALREVIDGVLPVAKHAASLSGYPREKHYLFLFQNNTEVRATGGFIGTYGVITMKDGMLDSFTTDDVYHLDDAAVSLRVPPPQPFRELFPKKERWWYLRDSNWWPDFPTSARKAAWFYQAEGGAVPLDGVIAITPDVISSMLGVLGPVKIGRVTYDAQTFTERLEYQVERAFDEGGGSYDRRKEVVGHIATELFKKMKDLSPRELLAVSSVLDARLHDRHLLLYFYEEELQRFAKERGWSGEVLASAHDYLMVIDSNMGSLKTDSVMEKSILYRLTESSKGERNAEITLRYTNTGVPSWKTTHYRDWVRMYVPQGSRFISAKGFDTQKRKKRDGVAISQEFGKTVFAGAFTVPSRSSRELVVQYRLPPLLSQHSKEKKEYGLVVQKQSGTRRTRFTGDLSFSQALSSYTPRGVENTKTSEKSVRFASDLDQDAVFHVGF